MLATRLSRRDGIVRLHSSSELVTRAAISGKAFRRHTFQIAQRFNLRARRDWPSMKGATPVLHSR
eukprot:11864074-Alexandrium_andersonii.AAC.1